MTLVKFLFVHQDPSNNANEMMIWNYITFIYTLTYNDYIYISREINNYKLCSVCKCYLHVHVDLASSDRYGTSDPSGSESGTCNRNNMIHVAKILIKSTVFKVHGNRIFENDNLNV